MRLAGRRAVVTGGASGIGRAIALRFAAEGAAVAVADRNEDGAARVGDEVRADGGTALAVGVDIVDTNRVADMVTAVKDEFGGVDLLVNNANEMPADGLMEMPPEQWDRDVAVTLRGPYLCTHAVLPEMVEQRSGTIVNIASVNGLGFYGNEAYSAAKAGLINLTASVAVRYGQQGIRANAIAAGTVRTPIWENRMKLDPQIFEKLAAWYPMGRVGEVDDIAGVALFLASNESAWVTGTVLPVDGGLSAGNYRMSVDLIPE